MAEQGVGNTALGAVTCRLIEQYEPAATRLFDDPLAQGLVGTTIRLFMAVPAMRGVTMKQMDAITQGLYGAQICRTRAIDDAVTAALERGIGQLVVLGAGYDTRAYRLARASSVKCFEVDLPAVQSQKRKLLAKRLGRLPANVTYVPIDFDKQTLDDAFAGTSFDRSAPAVFVWEGVTQYLSEAGVRQTLAFVGRCAPGSVLVFTYVLKSVIERRSTIPGAGRMVDRVASSSPWTFGLEPGEVRAYLEPYHLSLMSDLGNADYQAKYLRPLGRTLTVSEIERTAEARVVA